ncbi:MAG: recombination mediator RecR [Chloroflexi bacterium]|nr:recombination mediator RecR [Chloroflexota bacterium]
MKTLAEPVSRLIEELSRLPGIGPKTASRLTFYLLRSPKDQSEALAKAIMDVKQKIIFCSHCYNITESDPCLICTASQRDQTKVCVVEEPLDVLAIERAQQYNGLYHVLHGAISPVEGIGPEDLKIRELLIRIQREPIEEIILATNPNLEGEATAMYIAKLIVPAGVRVTRLARGLPMGGDLEYADEITLARAFEGRRDM